MPRNHSLSRRTLLICAVVIGCVGLVLAAGVIQPVKAEAARGETTEAAVAAFWVNISFTLAAAAILFLIAYRSKGLRLVGKTVSILLGLLVVLLGLALTDAASAYLDHGPDMRVASILLIICAAADILAGVLTIVAAIRFPAKT
jgi:hypothetical protein